VRQFAYMSKLPVFTRHLVSKQYTAHTCKNAIKQRLLNSSSISIGETKWWEQTGFNYVLLWMALLIVYV